MASQPCPVTLLNNERLVSLWQCKLGPDQHVVLNRFCPYKLMQAACGNSPPALWWTSVHATVVVKTGVVLTLLMLQDCHGCPAVPDCGASIEVLMMSFHPEAQPDLYCKTHCPGLQSQEQTWGVCL